MSQSFVVEVIEKPVVTPPESLESLAKAFNIEPRKVELMLKRLPGVATKPISHEEASVVVSHFEKAGLKAIVKSVTPPPIEGTSTASLRQAEVQPSSVPDAKEAITQESSIAAANTDEISVHDAPAIDLESVDAKEYIVTPDDVNEITELLNMNPVKLEPVASIQADTEEKPKLAFPEGPFEKPKVPDFDFQQVAAPKRDHHDLLRSTLIREPDPHKTLSDVKSTIPNLDPTKTMSGLRRNVRKTLVDAAPPPLSPIEALESPRRRGGLRRDLLLSAMLPAFIALIGTLGVTYFRLQPVLREGLWESARTPAIAAAASISSVVTQTPEGNVDYTQLQRAIDSTRQAFDRENISFIAAVDTNGELLGAWFAGGGNDTSSDSLDDIVRSQALLAITERAKALVPVIEGKLEVVSQPLMLNNQPVGAIVVGVTHQGIQRDILSTIGSVAIYSLIPLLLATLLAILFARPLARKVLYLTDRADQISRGELSGAVNLKSNNELGDLGESLERMRVSMQEALERLRRRRV
jgi:HAMP domain-containing protein